MTAIPGEFWLIVAIALMCKLAEWLGIDPEM